MLEIKNRLIYFFMTFYLFGELRVVHDESGPGNEENDEGVKMDWKDYVAFVLALLQTSLLPILITMGILVLFILFLLMGRNII